MICKFSTYLSLQVHSWKRAEFRFATFYDENWETRLPIINGKEKKETKDFSKYRAFRMRTIGTYQCRCRQVTGDGFSRRCGASMSRKSWMHSFLETLAVGEVR